MSQELAQDEAEADAEDYEIDNLENGHRQLASHDDDDDNGEEVHGPVKGRDGEEHVVFAMGEDSDDEDDSGGGKGRGYRDEDQQGDERTGKNH